MGEKVWDWFLPIRGSMGDGIRFEYNKKLVEKLVARARKAAGLQGSRSSPLSAGGRPSPHREFEDTQGSTALAGTLHGHTS